MRVVEDRRRQIEEQVRERRHATLARRIRNAGLTPRRLPASIQIRIGGVPYDVTKAVPPRKGPRPRTDWQRQEDLDEYRERHRNWPRMDPMAGRSNWVQQHLWPPDYSLPRLDWVDDERSECISLSELAGVRIA
jgi:hypothetical protein